MFEPPPDLSVPLGREPTAPRKARACIRSLLGDGVPAEFSDDAQLLTSELVTNAVMYTPNGCQLTAWFVGSAQALRVEVADGSADGPQLRPSTAPSDIGGRGLRLVASRASHWGVETNGNGKSVWFEICG